MAFKDNNSPDTNEGLLSYRKYFRPQGLLLSTTPGKVQNGIYTPDGFEVDDGDVLGIDFIILTDDNRREIRVTHDRIEKRERMINGRMRSYHIADKAKFDVEWTVIPSRAYDVPYHLKDTATKQYTHDGGAGAEDMYQWYKSHTGSFWVFLAVDRPTTFQSDPQTEDPMGVNKLRRYADRREMFFSDFSYDVLKRGGEFDFWRVQMTLEEA